MKQTSFTKPLLGLGTTMAAAILALALMSPAVNAQGKGGDRGGSGPSASPDGGKSGGGDAGGRTMSPGDRSGSKTFSGGDRGRSFTDQGSSTRERTREGKRFSDRGDGDRRRHSRRRGSSVTFGFDGGYYGYGYESGCAWLYRRAVNTGSRYWWRRYRACINY